MRGILDPSKNSGFSSLSNMSSTKGTNAGSEYSQPNRKGDHHRRNRADRIAEVSSTLRAKLRSEFRRKFNSPERKPSRSSSTISSLRICATTLTLPTGLSEKARQQAVDAVPEAVITYQAGVTNLVRGGAANP